MSQSAWAGIIIGIILVGGGVWWFTSQNASPLSDDGTPVAMDVKEDAGTQPTPATATTETTVQGGTAAQGNTSANTGTPAKTVTISYNGDAFDPSSVTINKGDTVKWVSTGSNMWVASASHPQHTVYSGTTRTEHCPDTSGTAFDQCAPGTSYSFTFQKTGTWNYHDHINAHLFGTVIVK